MRIVQFRITVYLTSDHDYNIENQYNTVRRGEHREPDPDRNNTPEKQTYALIREVGRERDFEP